MESYRRHPKNCCVPDSDASAAATSSTFPACWLLRTGADLSTFMQAVCIDDGRRSGQLRRYPRGIANGRTGNYRVCELVDDTVVYGADRDMTPRF